MTEIQIKQGWQEVKLGDIAAVTSSKRIFASDYVDNGIPFFRSKEIINLSNGDNIATELFITDQKYAEIKDRFGVPMKGDILITSVGTLGVLYQVNCGDFYFKDGNLIWIKDFKNKTDSKFLLYALKSNKNQEKLKGQAIGSSQKAFTIDLIKNFEITLPPLPIQNKIAEILGNYDDLIEANNRRIKILETQAAKIYTEWFVHYRYPGHENVPLVDSGTDFGMIPQGWEVRKVGDIAQVVTGKTPSTARTDYYNGNILFIKTPDMHGDMFVIETTQTLSEAGEQVQKNKTLPTNSIVVSCIGTVGVVAITSSPSQTNQQINSIVPKEITDYCYLYFVAKNLKQHLENLGSNGATMGNVNKSKFESIEILYADKNIRSDFFNLVSSSFHQILNLQQQNQNLKKSRDLLIPQLVGGLLEV